MLPGELHPLPPGLLVVHVRCLTQIPFAGPGNSSYEIVRPVSPLTGKPILALVAACSFTLATATRARGDCATAACSASASLEYLRQVMDEFHNRFPVYDDVSSPGNHFHVFAKVPSGNAPAAINGSWPDNPHSGATSIRCELLEGNSDPTFGGFYFLNGTLRDKQTRPEINFGVEPNAGVNLRGAKELTFWARGNAGGERIKFLMGGVGHPPNDAPYPDSTPAVEISRTLSTGWQKFTIPLPQGGRDLEYIQNGFGWLASLKDNPGGAVFFLDDIQYELDQEGLERRLDRPRFLRSFTTLPVQPNPFDDDFDDDIDFVLRNAAFAYDNALAILAFLAEDSEDGRRRAELIGRAFRRAQKHDRNPEFDDGRVRSVYAAGDISLPRGWTPNGRAHTVPIPGFYDETSQTFYEIEQEAIDTGNNAWVMIAMLALHRETGARGFLRAATRLGKFVDTFRNIDPAATYRGFQGGIDSPDSDSNTRRAFESSEHNLDVFAAFSELTRVRPRAKWSGGAAHAAAFVEQMWYPPMSCYLAGTSDPMTRNINPDQLPLDVQAWSTLALASPLRHPAALGCSEANHRTTDQGLSGFDFNHDNIEDGIWFEGTAQMAVAYAFVGDEQAAEALRVTLRAAQANAPFGNGHGIAAASQDGLTTGFETAGHRPFKYFRRLHVGATAWNVFAQLRFNPYYGLRAQ